jgi:hypothetical protein
LKKNISISGLTQIQREKELEKIKIKYEKKGYNFVEYRDNGMAKSIAIFDVDESILKKEKPSKILLFFILIFISLSLAIYAINSKGIPSLDVTPSSLEKKWPFTSNTATLKCYVDGDIESPVVIIEKKTYGLTGFADNKYGQSNINELNKVWLFENKAQGIRVNLSEVTSIARDLCKK